MAETLHGGQMMLAGTFCHHELLISAVRRFLHQYLVADTYRPFNEPCPPGFLAFAVLVVGVGFTYPAYLTFQNQVPISTTTAVLCFYLWSTGADLSTCRRRSFVAPRYAAWHYHASLHHTSCVPSCSAVLTASVDGPECRQRDQRCRRLLQGRRQGKRRWVGNVRPLQAGDSPELFWRVLRLSCYPAHMRSAVRHMA